MLRVIKTVMLAAICLLALPAAAGARPSQDVLTYKEGSLEARLQSDIYGGAPEGEWYLFLPSSADYADLALEVKSGVTLTREGGAASATYDAAAGRWSYTGTSDDAGLNASGRLDLTAIFGQMEAGAVYPALLSDGEAIKVNFIKASDVATLSLEIDKELSWLHEDKANSAKGTVTKTGTDGAAESFVLKKIKGRGHSSWFDVPGKKSYNITLDSKTALVAGAGKNKKWSLIATDLRNYQPDRTGLSNAVVLTMFKDIGGPAAVDFEFVNLYINGGYRGLYMLVDKAENNVPITSSKYTVEDEESVSRVFCGDWQGFDKLKEEYYTEEYTVCTADEDPAIAAGVLEYHYGTASQLAEGGSGGFNLEIDKRAVLEPSGFVTSHGICYTISEPEFASKEQVQEIAIFVQKYEDAVFSESGRDASGRYYTEYVDVESLADMFLIGSFYLDPDAFITSTKLFVERQDDGRLGKLEFGPAWDWDVSDWQYTKQLVTPDYNASHRSMLRSLLLRGDFIALLYSRVRGEFAAALDKVLGEGEGSMAYFAALIEKSYALNLIMWGEDDWGGSSIETFVSRVKTRFDNWGPIWSDETGALRGVTASADGDTLTASAIGASSYQWYRVSRSNDLIEIEGATGATLRAERDGDYLVRAMGTALAGTKTTAMYSNPVSASAGAVASADSRLFRQVIRAAGETRFETSLEIAEKLRIALGADKFDAVILANGMDFPDALAGSYLSCAMEAPVILVNAQFDYTAQIDYIRNYLAPGGRVYILGGINAVAEEIEDALAAVTDRVTRLGGATRYETNLLILGAAGIRGEKQLLVSNGLNFADALSASSLGKPILFVDKAGSLTDAQKAFIAGGDFTDIVILGGALAVPESYEAQLASCKAGLTVTRLAGADRYETCEKLVRYFYTDYSSVVLAYGENFPDGLAGGSVAHAIGAPLVIVRDIALDRARGLAAGRGVGNALVLGGTAAVPEEWTERILGYK